MGLLVVAGGALLLWRRRGKRNYSAQYPTIYPTGPEEMLHGYGGYSESPQHKAEVGGREIPRGPYELRT